MKIGFIGLGRMGTGTALNLQRAGLHRTVYNAAIITVCMLGATGCYVHREPDGYVHDRYFYRDRDYREHAYRHADVVIDDGHHGNDGRRDGGRDHDR